MRVCDLRTGARVHGYSVLPIPAIDRFLLTTTDMDSADRATTSQWV